MSPDDINVDNIDKEIGPLTGDLATKILLARNSPLAGFGYDLVSTFGREEISAWIGLAIIAEEASYGIYNNNHGLDERNLANPFSAHFTRPDQWPDCGKNALLIADANGSYDAHGVEKDQKPHVVLAKCSTKGFRLPTFGESAHHAIQIIKSRGLDSYRETPGYKGDYLIDCEIF
ncbi:MAG: hypothetical protein WCC64_21730 [Aliidongia sp.]